jgi:hypothetical protein
MMMIAIFSGSFRSPLIPEATAPRHVLTKNSTYETSHKTTVEHKDLLLLPLSNKAEMFQVSGRLIVSCAKKQLLSTHCRNFTNTTSRCMMSSSTFQAWRVDPLDDGKTFQGTEQTLTTDDLPPGDVLIRVTHSSLNYKDALSAAGNKGVTKKFPHTPGIDAVGTVVDSGDAVLVTGYDLGMNTDGGFGEMIRVPKEWVLPMPFEDPRTAMAYGTAGLTAALMVQKIIKMGASPSQGKVAVTGGVSLCVKSCVFVSPLFSFLCSSPSVLTFFPFINLTIF